jgi:single-strand DNA-binding protein
MNKVFLMGHLGHTPELQMSKAGKPYARLSLATNRRWVQGEESKEATDWHSVFVWGRLAEQCTASLQKGALVFVEGALTYWQVADSQTPFKNAIHGHEVRFLNSRMGNSPITLDNLDNSEEARSHNAVAHLS